MNARSNRNRNPLLLTLTPVIRFRTTEQSSPKYFHRFCIAYASKLVLSLKTVKDSPRTTALCNVFCLFVRFCNIDDFEDDSGNSSVNSSLQRSSSSDIDVDSDDAESSCEEESDSDSDEDLCDSDSSTPSSSTSNSDSGRESDSDSDTPSEDVSELAQSYFADTDTSDSSRDSSGTSDIAHTTNSDPHSERLAPRHPIRQYPPSALFGERSPALNCNNNSSMLGPVNNGGVQIGNVHQSELNVQSNIHHANPDFPRVPSGSTGE